MSIKEIKPQDINDNVFKLIGDDWFIVSAGNKDKLNGMTASWGGLGILWGRSVAFVFIRPVRYTKEFVDAENHMTLSFFSEDKRQLLNYFGAVSGHKEDKIAKQGLTVVREGEYHYFDEARLTVLAKKLYAQPTAPEFFNKEAFPAEMAEIKGHLENKGGYHTMYVVEIEKVLVKQ